MNITDVLEERGVPFRRGGEHHHVSEGWYGLDCYDCSPNSSRFRLGYNISGRYFSCWVCGGKHGPTTLSRLTGLPIGECFKLLGGLDFEKAKGLKRGGKLVLPSGVGSLLPAHKNYLRGRKVDPDKAVAVWGLMGTPLNSSHPWRIVFPVHDRGRVVSWTARALGDKGLRYVSARPDQELLPIKDCLFGADHVRDAAIVVEGPLDAVRIGPGAVATMGTGWSTAQLERVASFSRRAVCFDTEPDAQRRARRMCEDLAAHPGRTELVTIQAADPGSASDREIGLLRKTFLGDR